jgi:hypothetical protein
MLHGKQTRLENVDAIDGVRGAYANAYGDSLLCDVLEGARARFGGELLGVVKTRRNIARRQHYRCCDNGPCERSAAGFVHAGHVLEPALPEFGLQKDEIGFLKRLTVCLL